MSARGPFYTEDHEMLREQVRRFAEAEIAPNAEEWDEAEGFPRDLYRKAAEAGILGVGFPEDYGGAGGDIFHQLIVKEELSRGGSGGVRASLMSHTIALPPILAVGSEDLKRRVLPPVLAGEKIAALAITEPHTGSDVASLRTAARRDGDHYVVSGQKIFITSGIRADFYTVAVRTGGPGMDGISLLLVERDRPGFAQTPLKKMGWWCSDTAILYFDQCRVPAANLIGAENAGFKAAMRNFNSERLGISASVLGSAKACYEDALAYARERVTFGRPLIANQVVRHKLVDMATRIRATEAMLDATAWRVAQGETAAAEIAMLKNQATATYEHCASEAVQLHGGAGILRGSRVERLFRESKILSIGGGSAEIMKDLAARQMGY